MSKRTANGAMPKVIRTSAGLRDALFDELDRLRSGETNATNANATARLAGEVVNIIEMELEVQKYLAKAPLTETAEVSMPKPLSLGSN